MRPAMQRAMRASIGSVFFVLFAMLRLGEARADDDDQVLVRGSRAGGFVSSARVGDTLREVTDAASLIEPLPGIHVRRLGADDSFATLSIRGSSSSQVAVYFAGVPLAGGADPSLDLATLPLWPGAGARVFRTFAPAALGRGSLGGTLVIDPPSPRETPRTEIWTAVGSFGSSRLRIGDVRAADDVRIATGISASRSDDDFTYLDPNATRDAGSDVFTRRRNAAHAAASGLLSIAMPVRVGSERGALTITALAQARRQELPGAVPAPTPFQRLDTSRLLSALELTLPIESMTAGIRLWGRREGSALRDDPEYARNLGTPSATDDVIVAAGTSAGIRSQFIELRLDGSAERFAPGTWVSAAPPPGARRTNAGLAADAHTMLGDVALTASGRADTWIDASDNGTSTTEARPTGNVGIELPFGPVLAASHAGFVARPPSFVERYGDRGAFIGTPNLRPESAFTTDAGANYHARFGPLRLELESTVFATWAEDLITNVYVGLARRARPINIGHARIYGIESALRTKLDGFEARVSHTGLATVNETCVFTIPGICERPPLPGRPAHDLVADVAWQRGPVRLRYGIDLVSGIRADTEGAIEVPTRVLHGASIRVDVARGLALTFDVRNLFDLRAVEYSGILKPVREPIGDLYDYPLPGRRLLLSVQWILTDSHEVVPRDTSSRGQTAH